MSDTAQQQPSLTVNAQYIKDLSFEIPGAPAIFSELTSTTPELNMQVGLDSHPLGENLFESTLRISVEAKVKEKTAFIADITYAGIFTLAVPAEHVQAVLMIECPRLLFPFARSVIADVTRDGGFPPVLLQPLDFVAMYRSRLEQAAAEPAAGPNGKGSDPAGQPAS